MNGETEKHKTAATSRQDNFFMTPKGELKDPFYLRLWRPFLWQYGVEDAAVLLGNTVQIDP